MISNDNLLLVIGAILGFISAFLLELARHWLINKRTKAEKKNLKQEKKQEQREEFLTDIEVKHPAWVAIKKTPKSPLISFTNFGDCTDIQYDSLPSNAKQLKNLSRPNEKYIVTGIQIVGRDAQCEIRLKDKKVSRKHLMIRFENDNYVVYDLGSSNGTFVNGVQITDGKGVMLSNGDVVKIGNSEFSFGIVQPPNNQTSSSSNIVTSNNSPNDKNDVELTQV